MFKGKRLLAATGLGLVMGVMCYLVGSFVFGNHYSDAQVVNIMINRMLMGFVIGISVLKMPWYWHGMLLGIIVGLPFLMADYLAGFGPVTVIAVAIVNPLYGLLIEFFTSKVFRQPAS